MSPVLATTTIEWRRFSREVAAAFAAEEGTIWVCSNEPVAVVFGEEANLLAVTFIDGPDGYEAVGPDGELIEDGPIADLLAGDPVDLLWAEMPSSPEWFDGMNADASWLDEQDVAGLRSENARLAAEVAELRRQALSPAGSNIQVLIGPTSESGTSQTLRTAADDGGAA